MLLPYFVMVFYEIPVLIVPFVDQSMLNSGTHYFFSLICRYGILPDFAVPRMFLYFCCSLFIYFIVLWPFDNVPPLIQYMGHEALFFSRVVSLSVCACKHLGGGIATSLPSKEFKLHSDVVKFWFGGFTEGAVRWILDCVTVLSKLIALKVETKQIHETHHTRAAMYIFGIQHEWTEWYHLIHMQYLITIISYYVDEIFQALIHWVMVGVWCEYAKFRLVWLKASPVHMGFYNGTSNCQSASA